MASAIRSTVTRAAGAGAALAGGAVVAAGLRRRAGDRTTQVRALTIGRDADDLTRLWADEATRALVFERDDPPAADVELQPAPAGRGTVATVRVAEPMPGLLLGRALRRFKALAEASEIPTTARNPSARRDVPEEA